MLRCRGVTQTLRSVLNVPARTVASAPPSEKIEVFIDDKPVLVSDVEAFAVDDRIWSFVIDRKR